ncbi:hypothetical protein EFM09_00305 [Latilactobacillus curvatus]|uniref:Uncharacterized protein n=1 Tax=Latilactobacillus curvatus TaxID=28038 RepID=A0A385ABE4_LATCU|nr:hypothetical protein DT351_00540 [Latilactobacillus curvatus]MCT1215029.1 hypothetical protein [Latilactobacillus curvatus]MCT3524467.1 hypothetical protein [Latilactobacillus curvatus]
MIALSIACPLKNDQAVKQAQSFFTWLSNWLKGFILKMILNITTCCDFFFMGDKNHTFLLLMG